MVVVTANMSSFNIIDNNSAFKELDKYINRSIESPAPIVPFEPPALPPELDILDEDDHSPDKNVVSTVSECKILPGPVSVAPHQSVISKEDQVWYNIKNISEGTYGKVFYGKKSKHDKVEYAVKRIKHLVEVDHDKYNPWTRAEKEFSVGNKINHPNVVRVVELIGRDVVMLPYNRLTSDRAVHDYVEFMYKFMLGLQAIHKNKVIHGDIKPENIMVNYVGEPVIGDFSSSEHMGDHLVDYYTKNGPNTTVHYRAPELWAGFTHLLPSADIYAAALSLIEILSDQYIFPPGRFNNSTSSISALKLICRHVAPIKPPKNSALWGAMSMIRCMCVSTSENRQAKKAKRICQTNTLSMLFNIRERGGVPDNIVYLLQKMYNVSDHSLRPTASQCVEDIEKFRSHYACKKN